MGDFGDVYDMGFGGIGTFIYEINSNLSVIASAGYLTWSGKDAFTDWTFSSIPVLAGLRYSFGKGKFNPFISGQLGMHFGTTDVPSQTLNIGGIMVTTP